MAKTAQKPKNSKNVSRAPKKASAPFVKKHNWGLFIAIVLVIATTGGYMLAKRSSASITASHTFEITAPNIQGAELITKENGVAYRHLVESSQKGASISAPISRIASASSSSICALVLNGNARVAMSVSGTINGRLSHSAFETAKINGKSTEVCVSIADMKKQGFVATKVTFSIDGLACIALEGVSCPAGSSTVQVSKFFGKKL